MRIRVKEVQKANRVRLEKMRFGNVKARLGNVRARLGNVRARLGNVKVQMSFLETDEARHLQLHLL